MCTVHEQATTRTSSSVVQLLRLLRSLEVQCRVYKSPPTVLPELLQFSASRPIHYDLLSSFLLCLGLKLHQAPSRVQINSVDLQCVLHAPSISFSRQVAAINQETYSSQQRIHCEFRPDKATKRTLESIHARLLYFTLGSILYLRKEITYHCGVVQVVALMCTEAMRTANTTFRTLSPTSMFFFTDSLVLLKAFLSSEQMCLQ